MKKSTPKYNPEVSITCTRDIVRILFDRLESKADRPHEIIVRPIADRMTATNYTKKLRYFIVKCNEIDFDYFKKFFDKI